MFNDVCCGCSDVCRYEVLDDPTYATIATYFLNLIRSTRTYATGGSNSGEHWGMPHRLGDTLGVCSLQHLRVHDTAGIGHQGGKGKLGSDYLQHVCSCSSSTIIIPNRATALL